jgi:hypothetical protein
VRAAHSVIVLGVLCFFEVVPAHAAVQCDKLAPIPPQNVDLSYTGRLNASVDSWFAKLANINGGAEGTYHEVSNNVLAEFPQADRLYMWERVLYLKCQLIAESNDLSTDQKLRAVDQLVTQSDKPPASVTNNGDHSIIIQGSGNTVNQR